MGKTIYNRLKELRDGPDYPFHMPGHKRNTDLFFMDNPYGLDITEIDGFDNLHDAKDLIKNAMDRAARIYQSEETHFLVNGSTGGMLSGILGATREGDRILMMRNCHKSAYNAVLLNHLDACYLYPDMIPEYGICGRVTADQVNQSIKKMDVPPRLIVLVSPTYEGILSEVKEIVLLAHSLNIPVLVDEAHGAHFGFYPAFPVSAVSAGADIVIQSLHKTMPCFTQTALIHLQGNLIDRERIRQYLSMLQTSSPSYLFMASIDECMEMVEKKGQVLFQKYAQRLSAFYNKMESLQSLRVMGAKEEKYRNPDIRDLSKILIHTGKTTLNGHFLQDILWKTYHLQMEMVCENQVLAMTSISDTDEGFQRLSDALILIDQSMKEERREDALKEQDPVLCPTEPDMGIWQAFEREKEWTVLEDAEGKTAGDYVYPYPPGIPILVPGEIVNQVVIDRIRKMLQAKLDVKGIKNREDQFMIQTVKKDRSLE
ncbi:MAG: aminotransferase class I/II-fold pyridoxal phosphate-dependent enzyme [Clostridiales bacterium]|nr:aminotransferase class I/II-fold pyridoxal phosphate-dependent enzyme [Clostridiales bacterium]